MTATSPPATPSRFPLDLVEKVTRDARRAGALCCAVWAAPLGRHQCVLPNGHAGHHQRGRGQ